MQSLSVTDFLYQRKVPRRGLDGLYHHSIHGQNRKTFLLYKGISLTLVSRIVFPWTVY